MGLSEIFYFIGGLALFLYGLKMMGEGLEAAAGNQIKKNLKRLTRNRFSGVAAGTAISAMILSSSATTAMTVGFVDSGLIALNQAVWVIMGANIGTTVTAQLIALNIGRLAPVFAFVGVMAVLFIKDKRLRHIGGIVAGLGVLFIGMEMMAQAVRPLQSVDAFVRLAAWFQNPFLGILAGVVFTALIQSSGASIGILQTLAVSGLIPLSGSVYVLFGQNIGTTVTTLFAGIGCSRNAKRATLVHLIFNLIGTGVFVAVCRLTPFLSWMRDLAASPAAQIANVHTIFNVVTMLILLPAGKQLAKLTCRILPDLPEDMSTAPRFLSVKSIRDQQIGALAIVISQLRQETVKMFRMARSNVERSFEQVEKYVSDRRIAIEADEEHIDYLNAEISKYISQIVTVEMPEQDGVSVSAYFKVLGDIERIGDHAMKISGYAQKMHDRGFSFSLAAMEEVRTMRKIASEAFRMVQEGLEQTDGIPGENSGLLTRKMDELTEIFRQNQIGRLKRGECSGEACVIYSEMLTDFERISNHLYHIGGLLPDLAI